MIITMLLLWFSMPKVFASEPTLPRFFSGPIGHKDQISIMMSDDAGKLDGWFRHDGPEIKIGYMANLTGAIATDGTFTLKSDPKGGYGQVTILGKQTGKEIQGTVRSTEEKETTFQLKELEQDPAAWAKEMPVYFRGTIGEKIRIAFRVDKRSDPSKLAGIYKYEAQPGFLHWTGKLRPDGTLGLEETDDHGKVTGLWEVKLLGSKSANLSGVWINPKNRKKLKVNLSYQPNDPLAFLDETQGLKIKTKFENLSKGQCVAESEYDQIAEYDGKTPLDKLNALLKSNSKVDPCEDDERSENTGTGKVLRILGGRYVVLTTGTWMCCGAHGTYSSNCQIFDLKENKPLDLAAHMRNDAEAVIEAKIVKDLWEGDAEGASSFISQPGILSDLRSGVCPNGKGTNIIVHAGPYPMGGGEQQLDFSKAEWRKVFLDDEVTRALFGK